jgi:hypothetical protein
VTDHALGIRELLDLGDGGAEARRGHHRFHVGARSRLARRLVRLVGDAVQDEPERERGGRGQDGQQQEAGLDGPPAQVARREP